jgi:hypothetical protein
MGKRELGDKLQAETDKSWTAAGSEAPRRFGSSVRNRKAVSPLRSATAFQELRAHSRHAKTQA